MISLDDEKSSADQVYLNYEITVLNKMVNSNIFSMFEWNQIHILHDSIMNNARNVNEGRS